MPLLFRAVNPGAQTAIWPDVIDYKLLTIFSIALIIATIWREFARRRGPIG